MSTGSRVSDVPTLLRLIQESAAMALEEYNKTGVPLPTLDSTDHHPLDDVVGSLTIKRAIRTLEAACEQLCVTLAPPGHTLVNVSQ